MPEALRPKNIYELSLEEFTRSRPVIKESDFTEVHLSLIQMAEEGVRHTYHTFLSSGDMLEEFPLPTDELRAIKPTFRKLLLIEKETECLIGGISEGTTYITPDHRGRGFSKYLHLALDGGNEWQFLHPSAYSPGGYRARMSAHKEAVRLAVEAGLPVPDVNLKRYGMALVA